MSIQVKKDHVFLEATTFMQEACSQLHELGITYFERVSIGANGTFSMVSSNGDSNERIFNEIEPNELNFDFSKINTTRYIYSEDLIKFIPKADRVKAVSKIKTSQNDFDIRNLFQINNIQNHQYEAFVFGTSANNDIDKSVYLNKLHDLESFLLWFKANHSRLINDIDSNSIKLDLYEPNLDACANSKHVSYPETILKTPSLDRYYFNCQDKSKYLTKREYQVFSLLFRGYKHKEVAMLLGISARTVDSLIAICLRRNNIATTGQMYSLIMSSELRHCFITQY